jgi:hypothetical protein
MKKYLIFHMALFVFVLQPMVAQQVAINEFMSSNGTTVQDQDGDYSDWLEIFNAGENSINLEGFMISDDTLVPEKWIFPEITLLPDSFLLIFASDKDRYDTTELHTNFKIKSTGEYLVLSDASGLEINRIDPVSLSTDISFGRYPDGAEDLTILSSATPGHSNAPGTYLLTFSAPAGSYGSALKVDLSTIHPDDIIYYTQDGSLPDQNSPVYTDSILLDHIDPLPNRFANIPTTPDPMHDYFRKWTPPEGPVPKANVLRAVAYCDGLQRSRVVTNTYFVDPDFDEKYPYHIVSLSTDSINLFGFDEGIYVPGVHFDPADTDWTGNYYQKGDEWECPMHFEYFEDGGNRVLDQDGGMRIHGKITRHAAQKSLRLYARSEYGKSYFNYPFMLNSDQDKFKRIILRTTYADGTQTIIKDAMISDLVKDFNLEMMHYRPVVVFINGEYWGTHTLRDRIDKYYISLMFDVEADSLDLLENNMTVIEGSKDDYQDMITYIEGHDLSVDEHYEYIKTRMDVDNYIDYLVVQLYFNNLDWPGSNVKYWREQKPGAKWRWILFDLDNTCSNYAFNSLDYATFEGDTSWQNPTWATLLFRNLLKNEDFEEEFLDRFAFHLNHKFQSNTLLSQINMFTDLYEQGVDLHIQRWNFPRSHNGWLSDISYVFQNYARKRPCKMTEFILDHFGLEEDEFGFVCDSGIGNEFDGRFLFPNPALSQVRIDLNNWLADVAKLQVYNEMGQLVMDRQLNISMGKIIEPVDVSGLRTGIYIFRVTGGNKSVVSKFIKTSK